jgi:membrane protein
MGSRRLPTALERLHERWPAVPQAPLRAALLLREVVFETIRGFRADRGADLASSLSFATLLTAIPLLATFSLFLATFFQQNVGIILDVVNSILPYHTARVTQNLREFVGESTTISGIGLAVLALASLRLVFTIERIFNAVWGAPVRRKWIPRIALYTVGLFALAMLIGAIGLGTQHLLRSRFAGLVTSSAAESFFPVVIEFLALTLLYRFLPNAVVRWSPAALAAGTVALLLEVLRWLFGLYVRMLSRVNLITGSLTLVLLTLVSVFLVWVLILLGVELAHVLQTRAAHRRLSGQQRAGRAENAVRMLLSLASTGPQELAALYRHQEGSSDDAREILDCLRDHGLVAGDPSRGYALAREPDRITVSEIVDAISPDLYTISPREEDSVVLTLEPLFQRLDGERRALLATTLAELKP